MNKKLGLVLFSLSLVLTTGCASTVRQFSDAPIMHADKDRVARKGDPVEYYSPFAWDAADNMIFRPLSDALWLELESESVNVNALDEVPDSSWFENRIGVQQRTPAEFANAACGDGPVLDESEQWTVVSAKPNGANPGFIVADPRGVKFMVKFDGTIQGERATSADVVGSILYWNVGFHAPCNRIHFFRPENLIVPDGMMYKKDGKKVPLTRDVIDAALKQAVVLPDGRIRASASRFVDGQVIGPWKYAGTRPDDANDVVPHQHRRELRGGRLLAAWLNHFDAREQNTMATWVESESDKTKGYVRHYYIDFGDCFGSEWDFDGITRRLGHSGYFDVDHIAADWFSLGLVKRPWHGPSRGPAGRVLQYFNIGDFRPEEWRPGYQNPAFSRMTERDGAWMARILSQITPEQLDAAVDEARIQNQVVDNEIRRVLRGRLHRIVDRYFRKISPLSEFKVESRAEQNVVCMRDLAVDRRLADPERSDYRSVAFDVNFNPIDVDSRRYLRSDGRVCFPLPTQVDEDYFVFRIEVLRDELDPELRPLDLHFKQRNSRFHLVGVERSEKSRFNDR